MVKEEKLIFVRVLLIFLAMLLVNTVLFMFNYGYSQGISGFAVKEIVSNASQMPLVSKIILLVQWGLLLLLLLYAGLKDSVIISQRREIRGIHLHRNQSKERTDLDVLYDVLRQKRRLRITTIAKAFKVEEEVATEWGKILESGGLAELDYPGFGKPVLRFAKGEIVKRPVQVVVKTGPKERVKVAKPDLNKKQLRVQKKVKKVEGKILKRQKKLINKSLKRDEKRAAKVKKRAEKVKKKVKKKAAKTKRKATRAKKKR
jgi:hypothetical protein